ncbi:MAG: hypothetical protein F6K62_12495 [Sphaerospermopsis sp. SIO1G2]|nr:hypothetical protein [Sphaerospermopsis sp. SIO1G1]NET71714.1 hypothetical protein [Sphaerospermopsis sp. SIO1G2]
MRFWHFWVNTIVSSSQYHPPRFIELLMLILAIAFLIISTIIPGQPFVILGLSFVLGASSSILVREAIFTTNYAHPPALQRIFNIVISLLLFCISIYGFVNLIITG